MAITGTWKDAQAIQVGALKWGTGVNPIHSHPGGPGRNTAPNEQLSVIPDGITDPVQQPENGYTDEDMSSVLFGYGFQTGTAERPPLGTEDNRSDADDFPPWGNYPNGVPGGTVIRSENVGATLSNTPKQIPNETVSEGWLNKPVGSVEDSRVSDESQLYIQTSMTQRDKTRAGSQISGTASQHDAPIKSRIPGQRLKVYSGQERHADMTPKAQDLIIRPFWNRSAGTGYRQWMYPNEMAVTDPLYRVAPADPYQGADSPSGNEYGYVPEDLGYY